jgi:hypothetical protein
MAILRLSSDNDQMRSVYHVLRTQSVSKLGRCGEMFAMQRWQGIDPDLLLLGKAFAAGGQPIAALLGTDEVMGVDLH